MNTILASIGLILVSALLFGVFVFIPFTVGNVPFMVFGPVLFLCFESACVLCAVAIVKG